MKVRDHLYSEKEYKGRQTEAVDSLCPCRPCWNPHDCGYNNSAGEWIVSMECATRYNSGCPTRLPMHVIKCKAERRKRGMVVGCYRCRNKVVLGEINFVPLESINK